MSLGQIIKQLRNDAGLSQFELAEKIDVHVQTVSKWEREVSFPDFSILGIIAKNLGVSLDRLFDIESERSVDGNFDGVLLSKTLCMLRKQKGVSQQELANVVNVSADAVSKWERAIICPSIDTFKELCKYFGVLPSSVYYSQIKNEIGVSNGLVKKKEQNKTKRKKRIKLFIIAVACVLTIASILPVFLLNREDGDTKIPLKFSKPLETTTVLRQDTVFFCDLHKRYCILKGIDFVADNGQNVYAVMSGTVTEVNFTQLDEESGVEVVIENGEYKATFWSIYLEEGITVGSIVYAGDVIGTVGKHIPLKCQRLDEGSLHVEISKNGTNINLTELFEIE